MCCDGWDFGTASQRVFDRSSSSAEAPEKNPSDSHDEDDARTVTWEEEHNLPAIVPVRDDDEWGLPVFDVNQRAGRRSRVFRVLCKPWAHYWNRQYTYTCGKRAPLSWGEGVMAFLEQRLLAANKKMSDIFYEDPLTEELSPVNLKGYDGG